MQDDINQDINTIKTTDNPKKSMSAYTNFLLVAFISIITYIVIAALMKINISEIVDLELPIIVILSLLLNYISNLNRLITYIISIALTILLLNVLPQYAFFFIIVLTSELIVFTLEKIITNEHDF